MSAAAFTLALDAKAALGESPVWSVREEALYFLDIKGKALHRFDPATRDHRIVPLDEETGCVGLVKGGGFVAGMRSGIYLLNAQGAVTVRLADNPENHETNRFNDGRVDPAGRLILGTLDEIKAGGTAHLYRYDRHGLKPVVDGLLTSNGVAFSPDGRFMYHSDTPRFTIWRYAYDPASGNLSDRQVFAQWQATGTDRGRPDGAAVDSEGCYWSALYEGARVRRFASDGTILAEYPLPAQCPTMVAFGGSDLRTLFVTTASAGRPAEELTALPYSGGLFAMQVDVPGRPEPLFDPEI
ncbi:SMP-30/gluconolactonase/LRE family protein [Methylovirgula sp. 4M-Z18]|uniref:SMP-30/gluconolactonase/LRE family protein n=1 Tax=Methylovirgula sp. 4M-Z18 TaxID=2293567 RepID=UPI000E2E9B85|nr:SMP-30/gluconolactonase/LRE family protein [Methylovirgula sp. 4M-Z18]RFB80988.1 SMP-30/gluconolactonase/LRE family protein [Methylovirgula sp. 4M-Z18]